MAAADPRLDALVRTGVQDLDALRRTDGADMYYSAGSPWYLTLFGRDALWSARLGLPLGVEVAAGTLRALARAQGTAYDSDTEEEPGRIPHELRPARRRAPAAAGLLRHGRRDRPVRASPSPTRAAGACAAAPRRRCCPPSEAAARVAGGGTRGSSPTGRPASGLTNQGWKDSGDGVQFADGRSPGAVGVVEVQGYAYQAALRGADLLDAFGRAGGRRWRDWAADLAERFRAAFWCPAAIRRSR